MKHLSCQMEQYQEGAKEHARRLGSSQTRSPWYFIIALHKVPRDLCSSLEGREDGQMMGKKKENDR